MRKKLISLILCITLCCGVFAGCSLIEHNDEKDAQQVVATIDAIVDNDEGATGYKFESEAQHIYKSELISAMNQYGQTYMQNYSLSAEGAADRLLDELVTRKLLIIEAERLLEQEYIEWTKADDNTYMRNIYGAIDGLISSMKDNTLTDFGEIVSSATDEEEETSTTYPTPESDDESEDYTDYVIENGVVQYEVKQKQARDEKGNRVYNEDGTPKMVDVTEELKDSDGNIIMENGAPKTVPVEIPQIKEWKPQISDYPAMWGSEKEKSLEREALRRTVTYLKSLAQADFRTTEEDKRLFAEDDKAIEKVMNEQGIEYVYPMLGKTHYLEYLAGVSARESILISKLQNYVVGNVTVTDEEITGAYQTQRANQIEQYTDNQEAYQSAVAGGSITMLYYRDDSYFFVKHILIPFSDEQKAAFDAYKADPLNAGKDFNAYRDNMVNAIVAYPHVNGEDDTSRPMTVKQIFDEVKSAMYPMKSAYSAERKFDELTYKYNTDPGAFGYGKEYAVKRGDEENHSGYMEEFYDGAMKLYTEGYKEGQILDEYVVTDYGVHIMYLSRKIVPNTILELNSPLTRGAYKTVRDTFEETLRTNKQNSSFTSWQNERITYYQENAGKVHTYKDRYKSLYEE